MQFNLMGWSRAKGPESHQPWASPKVLDAKRNQALKARQPHSLEINLKTKRCGWLRVLSAHGFSTSTIPQPDGLGYGGFPGLWLSLIFLQSASHPSERVASDSGIPEGVIAKGSYGEAVA
jgi:hypothetical protein